MMVMLHIGAYRVLLESEKGLSTILSTLAKAHLVEDDRRYEGGRITTKGKLEVRAEMLPHFKFVKRDPDRVEVLQPRRIGPGEKWLHGAEIGVLSAVRPPLRLTGGAR